MISPYQKLRLRRKVRKTQKHAESVSQRTVETFDKHVSRRWHNLLDVRRFVAGWLILALVLGLGVFVQRNDLNAYYKTRVPAPGGVFVEGVVGVPANFNPIFAQTAVDTSVSRLLFAGLMRYNQDNQLVGDLADRIDLDESGTVYTVQLKDDIYWHDGEPITSTDVVFTYESIQDPDVRSPLNRSWQGVTVQAVDDRRVTFALENRFTPFPHSLTNGIIPEHVLGELDSKELRTAEYNISPLVGSGPFRFSQAIIDELGSHIDMVRSDDYHRGNVMLNEFSVETFPDHEQMIEAYARGSITAAAGLRTFDQVNVEQMPSAQLVDLPLFNEVFLFYKTSDPKLQDSKVRRALTRATDHRALMQLLDSRFRVADGPLLKSHLGYIPEYTQKPYDVAAARALLDEAGWVIGEDGARHKDNTRLELQFVAESGGEYESLAKEIQRQWAEIGVELNLQLINPSDLRQSYIIPHNYEVLLLGVHTGVDPDVFVYWHSTQALVGGRNLSEYKSAVVDESLEAGRTRTDAAIRSAKYHTFQQQWQADAPATALYQPAFTYLTSESMKGFTPGEIVDPTDRFKDVHQWTVNTQVVDKQI